MPPRSRTFVTTISASLCGLVGLLLGGCAVDDLVRLQRPDFEYRTTSADETLAALAPFLAEDEPLDESA